MKNEHYNSYSHSNACRTILKRERNNLDTSYKCNGVFRCSPNKICSPEVIFLRTVAIMQAKQCSEQFMPCYSQLLSFYYKHKNYLQVETQEWLHCSQNICMQSPRGYSQSYVGFYKYKICIRTRQKKIIVWIWNIGSLFVTHILNGSLDNSLNANIYESFLGQLKMNMFPQMSTYTSLHQKVLSYRCNQEVTTQLHISMNL